MLIIEILYAFSAILLGLYGLNNLILTWSYLRHRKDPVPEPADLAEWPPVTVQLPIYNEVHTIERLLAKVAKLDYPIDRLEIQVLDDSSDETRQLAASLVHQLQADGFDISHVTRPDRSGFKAGALAFGMESAKGELIAIFDADFLPPTDFLQKVVPHFGDPAVGCVQARWGHVNRDYSIFTRTQALGVDGHFVVQQAARSQSGLFLNFNGTAGMWRQTCIADAGGWQSDTLTEDLDLSFRAQLRGWRITYLPELVVPAELPAQISAFKRQQARWAQGSMETALKLIRPLLRSGQPWQVKLEGVIHLTGYLVHPLMLAIILLSFPMSFSRNWMVLGIPWLMVTAAGPPFMYAVAQRAGDEDWRRRLRYLPLLVMLGMGLSLNNSGAVMRAIFGVKREFQRTPKFDLQKSVDSWVGSHYAPKGDWLIWGELGLALLVFVLFAIPGVRWTFVPWLLLYAAGFSYVAVVNLHQTWLRRRWLARQPIPASDRAGRIPPVERYRTRAG